LLPPEPLTIRPVEPADVQALLAFYRSLSGEVARLFLPTDVVSADAIYEHVALVRDGSTFSLCLVDANGRIWGHAFVQGLNLRRPMLGIGLHETVIGQGYGRKLMERLLERTDAMRIPVVCLNVVKGNVRAENLYQSLGFVRTGQATFRSRNDSWSMERHRPRDPDAM
jgi:RimJ/RimL family protein N-acetyltransferase